MEKRELPRKIKMLKLEEKLALLREEDKVKILNLLISGMLAVAALPVDNIDQ